MLIKTNKSEKFASTFRKLHYVCSNLRCNTEVVNNLCITEMKVERLAIASLVLKCIEDFFPKKIRIRKTDIGYSKLNLEFFWGKNYTFKIKESMIL